MDTSRGVILLAEDERMLRNLMGLMLEADGYRVLAAADGEEAVQLSRRNKGDIHLFLSDIDMPQMNGVEAYHEIRAARPEIKVLLISGGMSDIRVPRSLPFLAKPFSMSTLTGKVREILSSSAEPIAPKTILIVDPDQARMERTQKILTGEGYKVITASNLKEGEKLSDDPAKVDLIISGVVSDQKQETLLLEHHPRTELREVNGFAERSEFLSNASTPEALVDRVRRLLEE
jgi:DNA-binding NtrC family response regulator